MKRGFTLVELMISVAILGICAALSTALVTSTDRNALIELQHAKAHVLLEYEARQPRPDPAIVERLSEGLHDLTIERHAQGKTVKIEISWQPVDSRKQSQSLVVFR